ncbi:MAG TPA: 30S ribosomal protein S24e [Thermoplasmata archaeon]
MEIEIVSKKDNQLLDRTEVKFKAVHGKEGTPQRDVVREKIASMMKATKERVIVDSMDSEFGKAETIGYAKVYKTKEAAMKYEREPILIRNKLKENVKVEKKLAAAPPPKAPAPAPKAAEKPAEKPAEKHAEKAPEKHAEKPADKKG